MNRITPVVKSLIIINVIIFLGTMTLPDHIKRMGMLFFPASEQFNLLQVVTSMFMHADFTHLLFNMMSLFFLGPMVEMAMGQKRFLQFYLICGLGASLAHMGIDAYQYFNAMGSLSTDQINIVMQEGYNLFMSGKNYTNPNMAELNEALSRPVLGASGAVYGVMIAFATMFPNVKMMVFPLPVPIAAKYLAIGLIGFGLYSGFGGHNSGIAHFAHIGGAVTGFILVKLWNLGNLR